MSFKAQTLTKQAPTGRFAVLHRLTPVPTSRGAESQATRVLIADGQALVRAGFRLLLEADRHITVVGEAATGEEAVALAHRTRPDVVLIDARLPGLDGDKKMSKSLGNTILLSDTPEEVTKRVRQMYTDPKRVRADIPGTVEGNPVFVYHDTFNPNKAEVDDLKDRYRAGKVGDVEVKTKLARALNAYLDPIRERRAAVLSKPDRLREILFEGSRRARAIAADTMARVRHAVKISYT